MYQLPEPMTDIFSRFYNRSVQTRKAHARMGVVSSSFSDSDELDQAPVSRAYVFDAYPSENPNEMTRRLEECS